MHGDVCRFCVDKLMISDKRDKKHTQIFVLMEIRLNLNHQMHYSVLT
jgi:hypothetical protein